MKYDLLQVPSGDLCALDVPPGTMYQLPEGYAKVGNHNTLFEEPLPLIPPAAIPGFRLMGRIPFSEL